MSHLLIVDANYITACKKVVNFAAKGRNWYRPKEGKPPPCDLPGYSIQLLSYRCVFSFTVHERALYRHLSISIPNEKYPNPFAFLAIAKMFGFTGWDGKNDRPPRDWFFDVNEREHCIVAAQIVGPANEEIERILTGETTE